MAKYLLAFFFCGFTLITFAQKGNGCDGCGNNLNQNLSSNTSSLNRSEIKLSVYPNPASDFIGVSNDEQVGKIIIFNMIGKEQKSFQATRGEKYPIADLANGMYLVKVIGNDNKLITTQRLQKR